MRHTQWNRIRRPEQRRGAMMVLAAVALVAVFAFAAFAIDIGFITLTKAQAQNAADAAAHAAVEEVQRGYGPGADLTSSDAISSARSVAATMVGKHLTGDLTTTPLNTTRDVRFGRRTWDSAAGQWVESWGVGPYNMVEVKVCRLRDDNNALPLSFGKIIGHDDHELTTRSVKIAKPGVGVSIPPGSSGTAAFLPFTVDLETWNALLDDYYSNYVASWHGQAQQPFAALALNSSADFFSNPHVLGYFGNGNGNGNGGNGNGNGNGGGSSSGGSGNGGTTYVFSFNDAFRYDAATGAVSTGQDNIPELNIYPDLLTSAPPGNRGTVDLGNPNNSTSDLVRQIKFGLNANDLSFFPNNEIRTDQGTLQLNGDTGISAGIQSALESIIGQVGAIPLFIEVSGNGNNAMYTIVRFVGVRVMAVDLRGGPNNRHLTVQPAPFNSPYVIGGNVGLTADSIFTNPVTLR